MSRNKHISKKTPCFPHNKNKAKPNEFETDASWLLNACAGNPKCWHALSMFINASSQNEFWFNPGGTLQSLVFGSGFLKCPQSVGFEAKYELALTYLEYDFSSIRQCEFYEKIEIRA